MFDRVYWETTDFHGGACLTRGSNAIDTVMVELGKYNFLRVVKQKDHGVYLEGDDIWGDILLPQKFVPHDLRVDDEIEVFLYLDSEDKIIATTQKPYATVGDFAALEVVSKETSGIYLDWGLDKDLFVPFREQVFKMIPGQKYVVYLYIDSTDRIAATTRLKKFVDTSPPPFNEGDPVELLVYQETDLGLNAIINGMHSGLIYKNDVMNHLKIGDKTQGYVKKIREDHKIDLTLQKENTDNLSEQIIQKLKEADGFLGINAKTSSDIINSMFGVSRKKFKIALGNLYKRKMISTDESGITLL